MRPIHFIVQFRDFLSRAASCRRDFFVTVLHLREIPCNVGGIRREDDENYVVTPGSSCQRSSVHKDRAIHTAAAGPFSCAACTSTAYLAKMGKGRGEAQKASTHRAEACNARAGKRSDHVYRYLYTVFQILRSFSQARVLGQFSSGFIPEENSKVSRDRF